MYKDTYIYKFFVNIVEVWMLVHNYFVDYIVLCLTVLGKCLRISLECFFSSDVGYLLNFHLALSFWFII